MTEPTSNRTSDHAPEHTAQEAPTLAVYYQVFGALMLLLVLTVAASYVNLGPLNELVALAIALAKALLVILFFMHVRYSSPLTWLFVAAGFVWLSILILLTLGDYLSRGWLVG